MATAEVAGVVTAGATAEAGAPPGLHLVATTAAEVAAVTHSNNGNIKIVINQEFKSITSII